MTPPTPYPHRQLLRWLPAFLFFALLLTTQSCKKEDAPPAGPSADEKLRAAFEAEILSHDHYRLAEYYSKSPIDYIDTDDVVKQETNLWPYVSPWLLDDWYHFTKVKVTCYQNAEKIPDNPNPTIEQDFHTYFDRNGVGMHFMNHEYIPLEYRLDNFSDTDFTVHAFYKNHIVYSRFHVVP